MKLFQYDLNVSKANGSLNDTDVSCSRMEEEMSGSDEYGSARIISALQHWHLTS